MTGHRILTTNRHGEPGCDLFQKKVPDIMTQRIVDDFKVIQVDEEDCSLCKTPVIMCKCL